MKYGEEEGAYRKLSIEQQADPGSPLSELLLREPGLYRFYAEGDAGGLDFLLPLVPADAGGQPPGPVLRACWPSLLPAARRGPRGILLADVPWRSADRRFPRGASRGLHGVLTVVPDAGVRPAVRPYLQPLADSFSLPCYTELPAELLGSEGPRDRVFYFDPRGVRDERTALVYLSALTALAAGGSQRPGGSSRAGPALSPARSGSYLLRLYHSLGHRGPSTCRPRSSFPCRSTRTWRCRRPLPRRSPIVLLLLLPYALKTVVPGPACAAAALAPVQQHQQAGAGQGRG